MMKGINLEELIFKGLKRIKDLIERPVDRKSIEELEKRLSEINVSNRLCSNKGYYFWVENSKDLF